MGDFINKILKLNPNNITEEEYNNLDKAIPMGQDASYIFGVSLYQSGVIIIIYDNDDEAYKAHQRKTELEYPNLYRIIKYCVGVNIRYIDFHDSHMSAKLFQNFDWR